MKNKFTDLAGNAENLFDKETILKIIEDVKRNEPRSKFYKWLHEE